MLILWSWILTCKAQSTSTFGGHRQHSSSLKGEAEQNKQEILSPPQAIANRAAMRVNLYPSVKLYDISAFMADKEKMLKKEQ